MPTLANRTRTGIGGQGEFFLNRPKMNAACMHIVLRTHENPALLRRMPVSYCNFNALVSVGAPPD
jgi:hypothetical protein